jgi:hypothetical protein
MDCLALSEIEECPEILGWLVGVDRFRYNCTPFGVGQTESRAFFLLSSVG